MTDGWVKLHRNIADNPVFHDAHLFKIFTWCVIRANASNQTKEVYGSKVKKGEFVTGKLSASAELHMKPSTVYDRLKKLEKVSSSTNRCPRFALQHKYQNLIWFIDRVRF